MKQKQTLTAIVTAASLLSTAAFGQEIQLQTEDGNISLVGKLVEFDGKSYTIETTLGTLTLSSDHVACTGEACPALTPPNDFVVSGSAELTQTLFADLVAAYARSQDIDLKAEATASEIKVTAAIEPGEEPAEIIMRPANSAGGIEDLLLGDAAVAITTRSLRDTERDLVQGSGAPELEEHILGIEGLVLVTAKDNPVPAITVAQAADVFSGQITNWAELGGFDAPIKLYTRDSAAGISEAFDDLVMAPTGRDLSTKATIVGNDEDLARLVVNDPNGIGFAQFTGKGDARALPIMGVCGLVVRPDAFSIQNEEYPLAHRLYALTNSDERPEFLDGLLNYIATDAGQAAVTASGRFSQSFSRRGVDQQGMRFASALTSDTATNAIPILREMVAEMVVSERLSATFRFETGSAELDSRARSDIQRAAALLSLDTDSRKIVRVMGFTDSLGDPKLNRELSLRRADQVVEALLTANPDLADHTDLRAMGFGDVSPIGCDQTAKGRWTNRRVELWISSAPS